MESSNINLPFLQKIRLTPPIEIINECFKSDTAPVRGRLVREAPFHPVVAIIGVGYVGSHLVEAFAKFYQVIAFDISKRRVEQIAHQFHDLPVRITSNAPDLATADAFLISVPTSLNHDKTINISAIQMAIQTVTEQARHGVLVVMESSVSVGMTRTLLAPLMTTKNVKVGMSPERVDPGRKIPAFQAIPKVISGIEPSSLDAVKMLYEPVFDQLVPVSSLEVAEMTKLYENCQRMVCAAYANEMADACVSLGINGWEVSKAAASKPFGYLPFQPGPGVGGHCIPVNPYYLLSTCDMPILQQATESSVRRPLEIVARLMGFLDCKRDAKWSQRRMANRNTCVLVVGIAFKKGQNVLYNSPGVAAIKCLLRHHDVDVKFADPLVNQEALPHIPRLETPADWTKEYLEGFDGILVAMDQVGLDMDLLNSLDGAVVHDYSPRSHR